jgi:hypothetical protein
VSLKQQLGVVALAFAVAACGAAPAPDRDAVPYAPTWTGLPTVAPMDGTSDPPVAAPTEAGPTATSAIALRALGSLAVKGRAPKAGYDRDVFGQRWADTDRNGCDTRNDILKRDLAGATFRSGTRDCVVLSGTLVDPLTGRTIQFSKEDANAVQIDHVVALSDAWQKGAQQWRPHKRLAFANDPLNLLAVDGPTNGSKSDSDAASWLPPNKAFRCPMVARQIAVKARYEVAVTAAEGEAMARVLADCPGELLPTGDASPVAPAAAPEPRASPTEGAGRPLAGDMDYGTCKQAKANGEGPYRQGEDVEYGYYRDQDEDGVVCE